MLIVYSIQLLGQRRESCADEVFFFSSSYILFYLFGCFINGCCLLTSRLSLFSSSLLL